MNTLLHCRSNLGTSRPDSPACTPATQSRLDRLIAARCHPHMYHCPTTVTYSPRCYTIRKTVSLIRASGIDAPEDGEVIEAEIVTGKPPVPLPIPGSSIDTKSHAATSFGNHLLAALQSAGKLTPYVVLGSTILALLYPPSFSWFTNKYYAPALGFLMFAVGINLNYEDFGSAFKRPSVLAVGYMGQFVLKPLLGVLFASIAVSQLHLPEAIGSGIILVSCVSGAQLSNYATFLTEPAMAPLSIVMTSLSTATAVFVIPALTRLLLGQRLPVDARAMMFDITQIIVAPVAGGIALKQFAPPLARMIKPFLPIMSLIVTGLCMGSPLATNIHAVRSPFGLELLLPIIGFHSLAFLIGHKVSGIIFSKESDRKGLQRTISFETGMQSSLLGLALANKYFSDPLVGLPSALSTVLMSLMGFGLVLYWNAKKERKAGQQ